MQGLVSIVVPTYNEAANVSMLYDRLAQTLAGRSWELIVVDDDSPDGTADVVRRLGLHHDNVRCLQRVQERGLCSAVHWGVQAAQGDIVVVMDGDLQHDPALIPRMLEVMQSGADIVSGSRFLAGRRASGLPSDHRQTLSDYGNRLTNLLLGKQLSDPLTGFFATSRRLFLESLPRMQADGFKVFFDLVYQNRRAVTQELAFDFQRRQHGESKFQSLCAVAAAVRRRLEIVRGPGAAAARQLRRCRADRLDRSLLHSLRQPGPGSGVLAVAGDCHRDRDGLQLRHQQRAYLLRRPPARDSLLQGAFCCTVSSPRSASSPMSARHRSPTSVSRGILSWRHRWASSSTSCGGSSCRID